MRWLLAILLLPVCLEASQEVLVHNRTGVCIYVTPPDEDAMEICSASANYFVAENPGDTAIFAELYGEIFHPVDGENGYEYTVFVSNAVMYAQSGDIPAPEVPSEPFPGDVARWFWAGFGFALTALGFGLVLRIVRNIGRPSPEFGGGA